MHAHMKPWICHGANSRQQQSGAGMQMENAAGWNGMNKQEIQTPGRTHRQGQHNEAAPLLDSCNKWNGGEMLNTLNRIFNIFLFDTWNHVQCQHDFTNPSRKTAELWGPWRFCLCVWESNDTLSRGSHHAVSQHCQNCTFLLKWQNLTFKNLSKSLLRKEFLHNSIYVNVKAKHNALSHSTVVASGPLQLSKQRETTRKEGSSACVQGGEAEEGVEMPRDKGANVFGWTKYTNILGVRCPATHHILCNMTPTGRRVSREWSHVANQISDQLENCDLMHK